MDSKKSKEGVRTPVILSKSKEQNFLKNCEKSMTNSIVWDLEKNREMKSDTFVMKFMKKTRQIAMLRGTNGYW